MHHFLAPHDPLWKEKFSEESDRVQRALGQNVVAIHHIGSTAIPDILAKPIVDILVEVSRIEEVDDRTSQMAELNYESMGQYGIGGRRYFRRSGPDGRRAFHVHVFEAESEQVLKHIAFRDYLLANPDKAKEYSDLKSHLVTIGFESTTHYQSAKAPFVEACISDAFEWYLDRS